MALLSYLCCISGTKATFAINFVCDQSATNGSLKLIHEEMSTSTHVQHDVLFEFSTALACEPAPVDCRVTGKLPLLMGCSGFLKIIYFIFFNVKKKKPKR